MNSFDALYAEILRTNRNDERIPIAIVPNVAVTEKVVVGFPLEVIGIKLVAETQPDSSTGTYLLTVAAAGNNLLAVANFDLETLVADTPQTPALTATAADLILAADALVTFTLTSNNLDLTGAGLQIVLQYRAR